MRGHVTRRGDSWRLFADSEPDALTGRRRQVTRTVRASSKRAAERELRKFIDEIEAGKVPPRGRTVGDLFDRWLEHLEPSLSPSTRAGYTSKIERYLRPALGNVKVSELTTERIDKFYRELLKRGGRGGRTLSAETTNNAGRVLHAALEQGRRWGWLTTNPASEARRPSIPPREYELPEIATVRTLIESARGRGDDDMADLVSLAVATGMRRGDLLALRWSDLDIKQAKLQIARSLVEAADGSVSIRTGGKGRRLRTIAVDPSTIKMLQRCRSRHEKTAKKIQLSIDEDSYIFSDEPDGSVPIRPGLFTSRWRHQCERVGVHMRFHSLRHLAATELIGAGVAIPAVAKRLGHSSPRTTMAVYAHAIDSHDDAAAAHLGGLLV